MGARVARVGSEQPGGRGVGVGRFRQSRCRGGREREARDPSWAEVHSPSRRPGSVGPAARIGSRVGG